MKSLNVISDTRTNNPLMKGYEYLIIGPTPASEDCTPAGQNMEANILECNVYADQLLRTTTLPQVEVNGLTPQLFILKNTGHEFGTYYELAVLYPNVYDDADLEEQYGEQMQHWLDLESGCENWDEDSLKHLREHKHPLHWKETKILKFNKAV